MIDCMVPIRISSCCGTGTVIVDVPVRFCMTIWLPRWRTCSNPCCANNRHSSRPEKTRSLPNRDLDPRDEDLVVESCVDLFRVRCLEEELERLLEVGTRLVDRGTDVLADRRPSIYGALASRQRPTRSVEASTGLRCTSVCRGARCLSGCGLALVRRSRMSCRRSPNIGADD